MRIITSWKVLMAYAAACGKARLAFNEFPTKENREILDRAIEQHDAYRDMCLKADEMIHFPDLS